MRRALLALALLGLAACREETVALPDPVTMTAEAVGHYCQMDLLEHPGPKAQVHLDGQPAPLFFSQVRDAVAYQRMPEQSHAIRAIYVNDMGAAESWEKTGADNWISAATAQYVVGSSRTGGMGAPELVPFSDAAKAQQFAAVHGGRVLTLEAISDADVLTPLAGASDHGAEHDADHGAGDAGDYAERLRRLSQQAGG
ncbi:MAG TPA: nitrous oxide reductase accessory protein NosL [Paracoccaceae bacterium]